MSSPAMQLENVCYDIFYCQEIFQNFRWALESVFFCDSVLHTVSA